MTMAMAAKTAATHGAASQVLPQGQSDKEQQILLLMILAGVIIFIQHDVSGKPQQGTQYAALGVVGFILLVLANFWPDVAFTFAVLFVVAVVLNSPNGVPLISKATTAAVGGGGGSAGSSDGTGSATTSTKPIIVANPPSTFPITVPGKTNPFQF